MGGERRREAGTESRVVQLGEERVDPGADVRGVVVDAVGGELGDVDGREVDSHGGLETFQALSDMSQVGGVDLVSGAGEKPVDVVRRLPQRRQ